MVRTKKNNWAQAIKQAREELNVKGFVAINRGTLGKQIYNRAKQIHKGGGNCGAHRPMVPMRGGQSSAPNNEKEEVSFSGNNNGKLTTEKERCEASNPSPNNNCSKFSGKNQMGGYRTHLIGGGFNNNGNMSYKDGIKYGGGNCGAHRPMTPKRGGGKSNTKKRTNKWAQSIKKARDQLGINHFVLINKGVEGKKIYNLAKELHSQN